MNGRLSYRAADNLRALGGLLIVLSAACGLGLIASLFELTAHGWTAAHTGVAVAGSVLAGAGSAVGYVGDRAAKRYADEARRARGEL
jgi:hypothetical protein